MTVVTCSKDHCEIVTTVNVEFKCENTELLRLIEIHFKQRERTVFADVMIKEDFKNGERKWIYKFYDTDPDLMVWKVYAIDKTWKVYYTSIK